MVCMLIFLYTKDEISYDQFHEHKAQLYRIVQNFKIGDQPEQVLGITNGILGETFARELPEVEQFVRVNAIAVTVKVDKEVFTENPLCADENFFSVFTFPLIEGNKRAALQDPHSVVLSKAMAKKYFGTTDALGKIIQLKIDTAFENFTVTAIAENSPQNSTLKAGLLLSYKFYEKYNSNTGWFGGSLNTFLLLSANANVKNVEGKMQALFDRHTIDEIAKAKQEKNVSINVQLGLQPLTAIHLSKGAGAGNGIADISNPIYSYILTCLAVFILIIACINFINLAIAQSLKRSKEIGIRKVLGSTRSQLIRQFLAESFLVSFIAFAIAIALSYAALPFFNELSNKKLNLAYLSDGYLYAGFFLLLLVTSFIAGFYPSLVLSAFQPIKVLYGNQKLSGKNYLTRGLIVLQFALAVFLIIGTIAINAQLNFLEHADLGYDSNNLVRLDIPINKSSDQLPALFKGKLLNQPGIINVAAHNGGRSISAVKADGKRIDIENNRIDENFLPAFKIPIIAGRNFSAEYPSDIANSVIVNESFLKQAGWHPKEAIGKIVFSGNDNKAMRAVIGVIRDYHFTSLKEKITPELFSMDTNFNYGEIWVKIGSANIPQTLNLLQSTYREILPYYPYAYQFMNDITEKNYETETRWKQIISIASVMFIFISCIGLLGLVMLSVKYRTREIGIRKVLGAAVLRIVLLISKEFIVLIAIAFLIAVPVGYYCLNRWLQDFVYRIDIGWWIFALAGAVIIAVALLTVSFQSVKAAIANPVKSLRAE